MKVEISDSLFEQYQKFLKERFYTDDVAASIEELIESELLKHSAPGYDLDKLTNCKTRYQLDLDISNDAWGTDDNSIFKETFLCVDVENLKKYNDIHGLSGGDEVLQRIAKQLRASYPNGNVYRFGGDEFIVQLKKHRYAPLDLPADVSVKHSIVKVVAEKIQMRNHFFNRTVLFHLDKGLMESTTEGREIICEIG